MQVDDLKIIRNEIDNSLKEIAKKYGGKINIGNITYEQDERGVSKFWGKLTFESESFVDKNFIWELRKIGLLDVNAIIPFDGGKYKFVGFRKKAKKYPYLYENVDTKERFACGREYAMEIIRSLTMSEIKDVKIEIHDFPK